MSSPLEKTKDWWQGFSADLQTGRLLGYLIGLLLSVGVGLAVIFAALETQSSRVLDDNGLAWPFGQLFGPAAFGESAEQAWSAITAGDWSRESLELYRYLLRIHVYADYFFVGAYVILGIVLSAGIYTTIKMIFPLVFLGIAGLMDLIENRAILAVTNGDVVNPEFHIWITRFKVIALVMVIVALVVGVLIQQPAVKESLPLTGPAKPSTPSPSISRRSIATAWDAIMLQRLSLLPALAFFILSVTAGSPILEQLPDVQRGWVDAGLWKTNALWAVQAAALVTVSVFVTTRMRVAFARARVKAQAEQAKAQEHAAAQIPPIAPAQPKAPNARLWLWLIAPVMVVGIAVIMAVAGGAGIDFWTIELQAGESDLHLVRLAVFVGVPAGIVIASRVIRWWWSRNGGVGERPYQYPRVSNDLVKAAAFVGNVATVSLLVVAGLGLIRAFIPLVILEDELDLASLLVDWAWIWVIVGSMAVVGPWLVLIWLKVWSALHHPDPSRPGNSRRPTWMVVESWDPRPVGWILLSAWVIVFFALALSPTLASDIGLAATAIFSIGALIGMISAMGVLMQNDAPAEVFRMINLRRTPYITVLAVTLAIVALFSGSGSVHEVDRGRKGTAENPIGIRATLDDAFADWVRTEDPCRITINGRNVRPMLLISAEGGGIRAAYWTVRSLEALGTDTCAGTSALFSAGASGGSVGLTVARFSGTRADPGITRAVQTVDQMAEDEILAAGADGMFTRDVFYGATGVPLPRLDVPQGIWDWHDRARLIEQGWKGAYDRRGEPWGDRSFLDDTDLSPVTGHLILNSTSVKGNCRVWISQLELPANGRATSDETFDPEYNCDKVPGPGPRTIDLFSAYGPYTTRIERADRGACLGDITAATAALLTARFPYVTPSAVVGPCPRRSSTAEDIEPYWPVTQLVDGGYIENTGLATITDLAPEWQRLVRDHNAAAADPAAGQDLVVPFVVYLSNGDLDTTRPKVNQGPTSESSLPLVTYLRGQTSLSGSGALLERARESVQIEQFCPDPDVCRDLGRALPRRVIVVDRLVQPEISAPLGWSLSGSTRKTLDEAIVPQFTADCHDEPQPPTCQLGYAPLGELRQYFGATG